MRFSFSTPAAATPTHSSVPHATTAMDPMMSTMNAVRLQVEEQHASLADLSAWAAGARDRDAALSRRAGAGGGGAGRPRPLPRAAAVVAASEAAAPCADPRQQSELARTRGNDAYRRKDFAAAVKLYSAAVDQAAQAGAPGARVAALANRAQAQLALQAWAPAAHDAAQALALDPTHVKAWMRQATALNALGKHVAAHESLCAAEALLCAPPPPGASAAAADDGGGGGGGGGGGVSATAAATTDKTREEVAAALERTRQLRAQADARAPATRLPVVCVASDTRLARLPASARLLQPPAAAAPEAAAGRDDAGGAGITAPSSATAAGTTAAANPPPPPPSSAVTAIAAASAAAAAAAAAAVAAAAAAAAAPPPPPRTAAALPATAATLLPLQPPRTSHEFERDWRRLRTCAVHAGPAAPQATQQRPAARAQWRYLAERVDPHTLSALFRGGLDPELLGELVEVMYGEAPTASASASDGTAGDAEELERTRGAACASRPEERAWVSTVRGLLRGLAATRSFALVSELLTDAQQQQLATLTELTQA
jgi:hypothetical protein